jgi:hypothetical protein
MKSQNETKEYIDSQIKLHNYDPGLIEVQIEDKILKKLEER